LATLVARNFDADLVPETGAAAAAGIAVGQAVVLAASPAAVASSKDAGADLSTDATATRARIEQAFATVKKDLEAMVRALPAPEASLFEPEIAIVAALEARVSARVLG